jgi:eukaryotic-like serine/threonine-protein kinase
VSPLHAGTVIDGFVVEACLHTGGMAHIYSVRYHQRRENDALDPGFPMVMKVPHMAAGDGAETILGFEVECQILQTITGPHVPRLVAVGDLERTPYLVMERIAGETLQSILDRLQAPGSSRALPTATEVARTGAALALAVHSLHRQNTCHLDLKPANVMLHPDGRVVLLDFGLSCHAHFPDLLAEEQRKAVGSPAWISPEQVVGIRGDPRSDVFAIGVMLYEFATGELPFGHPVSLEGLQQRLWMPPQPPRALCPDMPEWLQEVILRCLSAEADQRYPSAAHLAFDLQHPEQVVVTARGQQLHRIGFWAQLGNRLRASRRVYVPSPLPVQQIEQVPIVMVAVPHFDVSDATLYSLRQAVARSLGSRPGARLAVVTVISPSAASATLDERSETSLHRHHLNQLRQWAQPLDLAQHQASFHVLESSDAAHALVRYAEGNSVSLIIMGAATHGLQLQRIVATVPIKVAMTAPCSVMLIKQALPFERLAGSNDVR